MSLRELEKTQWRVLELNANRTGDKGRKKYRHL